MFGQPELAHSESDREILVEVRERLYKYNPIREVGAPVGIEVKDGVVTLTGWVRALSHKRMAERLAAEVEGVREVRNQLYCDDELIPAVARALAEDPRTAHDFPGVQVSSYLGHIMLTGYVTSQEEWDIADDVVVNVPGVRDVDNRLRIAPEELARLQA
ncbi:MAG TPA: BON domain-containing protein [Caldilineae bacterium]|nr:BON domain-containing protein [Caldilineae bacterium]